MPSKCKIYKVFSYHWQPQLSNEGNAFECFHKIILSFPAKKREDLNLLDNPKALLIDVFKGQETNTVNYLLQENNFIFM